MKPNSKINSDSGLQNRTEQLGTDALSYSVQQASANGFADGPMGAAQLTPCLPGLDALVKPFRFPATPHEFKVTALRECPTPDSLMLCDTPEKAAEYWRMHVTSNPYFNPECECLAVLILNTRRRVKGHQLVTIGTLDTLLVHPREVFRLAIAANASAIIVMHNLCAQAHMLCYVPRVVMCSSRVEPGVWPRP